MHPHIMPMPDQAAWPALCDEASGPVRSVTGTAQHRLGTAQARKAIRRVRHRPHQAQYHALAELTHDLRSPLSGIIGLIDLLDSHALSEADRERLSLIHAAGEQMLGLVDGVLEREFRSGSANALFHPSQVLNQCIILGQAAAGNRGLHFIRNYSPDLNRPVTGDIDALRVIVNNFLSNAVKFCASGPITVTSKLRERPTGNELIVAVCDTGPGIPRNQWGRVFKRGERLTSDLPGSGLGLAFCARRAAQAGGRLTVRSTPGKGTMLLTALPVCVEQAMPRMDLRCAEHQVPSASLGRTVLAVIESRSRQTALQAKLEKAGFQLVRAVCQSQALDRICAAFAQGRMFDAVIIDEPSDPALSGPLMEAIAIMSHEGAPIPIFALSENGAPLQPVPEDSYGFARKLHPDFRPDVLSDLIAASQVHWAARSMRADHCPA